MSDEAAIDFARRLFGSRTPEQLQRDAARFDPRHPPLVAREPGGWESVEVGGWLLGLPNETP